MSSKSLICYFPCLFPPLSHIAWDSVLHFNLSKLILWFQWCARTSLLETWNSTEVFSHLPVIVWVNVFLGLFSHEQEGLEPIHGPLQDPHPEPRCDCLLPDAWVVEIHSRALWCMTLDSTDPSMVSLSVDVQWISVVEEDNKNEGCFMLPWCWSDSDYH